MSHDILYLEDDHDMRSVVSDFLRDEGYDVTSVATAAAALAALQAQRFHLLLTDYHLPDNTAAWLMREANAQGLLAGTQVIVLTSEAEPRGVDGLLRLKKPVEGNLLLTEIARRVHIPVAPPPPVVATKTSVVRLSLYVSASLESLKAVRNLRRILQTFEESRIELAIHDVTIANDECMASIEEDRVVVTPTLVRRGPCAKMWILGDLSKRQVVEDMIREGLRA